MKRRLLAICLVLTFLVLFITGCGGQTRLANFTSSESKNDSQTSSSTSSSTSDPSSATSPVTSNTRQNNSSTLCVDSASANTIELSGYKNLYKKILEDNLNKYKDSYILGCYNIYSLYDFDKNGIDELIVQEGICEADYRDHVFTYNGSSVVDCGSFSSSQSTLYKIRNKDGYLISEYAHMGIEVITKVTLEKQKVKTEELSNKDVGDGQYDSQTNSEYIPLPYCTVNDYTLLKK